MSADVPEKSQSSLDATAPDTVVKTISGLFRQEEESSNENGTHENVLIAPYQPLERPHSRHQKSHDLPKRRIA